MTELTDAYGAQTGSSCYLLEFEFSSGTLRFTSAGRTVHWNGNDYTPYAVGFETIQESTDFDAQATRITLDGVDQSVIAQILSDDFVGRNATIRQAHINADYDIIDAPIRFQGLMNEAWEIAEDTDTGETRVETTVISFLSRFDQIRGVTADLESHKDYTGINDTFFRHINVMPEQDIGWGVYTGLDPGTT